MREEGGWAITQIDLDDRPSLDSRARVLFVSVRSPCYACNVRGYAGRGVSRVSPTYPPHNPNLIMKEAVAVQVFIVTYTSPTLCRTCLGLL